MNKYIGDENCFSRLVDDGDGHMITVWYEAHEEDVEGGCNGCDLIRDKCLCLKHCRLMPYCGSDMRADGRDVIWKEVEK